MPGVSFIYNKNGLPKKTDEFTTIINNLNLLDHHSSQIIKSEQNLFMGWNGYKEYPIRIINNEQYSIVIEGKIYNKDYEKIESEIVEITHWINQNNYKSKISEWLINTDGDFIIYIINNNNDSIFILNDIFQR